METRQKTKEELEQEEKDAALARQFQEQFDNEQAAGANVNTASQPSSQPKMENGVVTIACPACTFINSVKEPHAGTKYACKQCRTPLPIPPSMLAAPVAGGNSANNRLVQCTACGVSNRIPLKKADAFLCGSCKRQIMTAKPATSAAPTSAQRTVQVRCGQCSAINAVQVSAAAASVQFECGNCETVNEAAL